MTTLKPQPAYEDPAPALANKDLRRQIVDMVVAGRNGHIPSAFSIVDIIAVLYRDVLKVDPANPKWPERDYFILSKGHGCLGYTETYRGLAG